MGALEYLDLAKKSAIKYRKEAQESLVRNNHMNEIEDGEQIQQRHVDAVLTDFLNYMGREKGVDYALYTEDLNNE